MRRIQVAVARRLGPLLPLAILAAIALVEAAGRRWVIHLF
jgi:hypothetical protein